MRPAHNPLLLRWTRQTLFFLLAGNLPFVPDCAAQLSAADLLTTPRFSIFEHFALSPDNSSIAYTVERTEWPMQETGDPGNSVVGKFTKTSELWISDLRTAQSFRVCCEDGNAMLPTWSPDGQRLAFYKTHIFMGTDRSQSEINGFEKDASLVVRDQQTGATREFLKGECPYSCSYVAAIWLRDGYSLLLPAHPMGESDSRATPPPSGGGRQGITFDSNRQADSTIRIMTSESLAQRDKQRRSPDRPTTDRLVRSAGRPAIDMRIVDTRTGQSRRVLNDFHIAYSAVSPDRRKFAFADYQGALPNSVFGIFDIFVIDLDTLDVRKLLSTVGIYPGSRQPFTWSLDARFLAVSDQSVDPKSRNSKTFSDYIVVDTVNGSWRRIGKDTSERWFGARTPVWSEDGKYLSFIRKNRLETWDVERFRLVSTIAVPNKRLESIVAAENGQVPNPGGKAYAIIVTSEDTETLKAGFWEIHPELNRAHKLLEADEHFSFYAKFERLVSGGPRALFVWASTGHPDELYQADSDFKRVQRVTNLAADLDRVSMGRSQIVTWKNVQGNLLRGVLLLPSNFEREHRYPLIVVVYPLPEMTLKKNGFGLGSYGPSQNWQMFATRGYAVFMPDISTNPSTKMVDIARAVSPGVEKLIKRGVADPHKIGVVGHSDGGYATLALLVQSSLFRAGIMIDGHGDLIEDCSYDYLRLVIEESWGFKKTPWEDLDLYIRNSPYLYLDRVQTPLLILHGSADTAVPVHLGMEVFTALRRLGKQATYVEYEGEEHDPDGWSISHQLDVSERMISWFDEHLKDNLPDPVSRRVKQVDKY
jgi:dipeptidyl aminopeptidase/acylaminoacyl peptidase